MRGSGSGGRGKGWRGNEEGEKQRSEKAGVNKGWKVNQEIEGG